MKPHLAKIASSSGLAVLLAGAVAAAPAAASAKGAGLHVVASPFINNSCLSGGAVIAPTDMWAVGDIGTGSGCNPFQTVGGGSGPFQTLAEHFNGTSWSVVPTPLSTPPSAVWPARSATMCGPSGIKRTGTRSTR